MRYHNRYAVRYSDRMDEPTKTLAALAAVKARLHKLDTERERLRDQAKELIIQASRGDATPTEVADQSPFTPAYTRRIARAAGVEPGKPGMKPRKRPTTS